MENKPDEGSLDPHAQEAQRILDVLRDFRWEDIDWEVDEDEDSEYEESEWGEIQLRKERAAADREAELTKKEQQKNKYRLPFAWLSGLSALGWMVFTAILIYQSGLENPKIDVDYRVLIAMLGTAFGTIYIRFVCSLSTYSTATTGSAKHVVYGLPTPIPLPVSSLGLDKRRTLCRDRSLDDLCGTRIGIHPAKIEYRGLCEVLDKALPTI